MAAKMSKESEAMASGRHPAPQPYLVQGAGASLQPQMPVGLAGQPPVGFQQPAPYVQQPPVGPPQRLMGPPQQPMGGVGIPIATQSNMILVGQTNQGPPPMMGVPQQAALIRQPVSVAFGAPLLQPGVPMQQYTIIQAPPQMPQAPPPYPGPPTSQGDVRYQTPDAPDTEKLYSKGEKDSEW